MVLHGNTANLSLSYIAFIYYSYIALLLSKCYFVNQLIDVVHAFQEAGLETLKIDRDLAKGTEDEDDAEANIFIAGKKTVTK